MIVFDTEQKSREINTLLQSVHHDSGLAAGKAVLVKIRMSVDFT